MRLVVETARKCVSVIAGTGSSSTVHVIYLSQAAREAGDDGLLRWGHGQKNRFEPRSVMGRAIRYLLNNFRELGQFLCHATIPLDNNVSEAALRRVALALSA
jgi:hypothetical protein